MEAGLPEGRLRQAQGDLAKLSEGDAESTAELAQVEAFAGKFKEAKEAPTLSKEDAQSLRAELESLMQRLSMSKDLNLPQKILTGRVVWSPNRRTEQRGDR